MNGSNFELGFGKPGVPFCNPLAPEPIVYSVAPLARPPLAWLFACVGWGLSMHGFWSAIFGYSSARAIVTWHCIQARSLIGTVWGITSGMLNGLPPVLPLVQGAMLRPGCLHTGPWPIASTQTFSHALRTQEGGLGSVAQGWSSQPGGNSEAACSVPLSLEVAAPWGRGIQPLPMPALV